MEYDKFISYLDEQGCFEDPTGIFQDGSFFNNCVSGDICYVSKCAVLTEPTCCHIFIELGIPAPFDLESAFEVYKLFRTEHDGEKGVKELRIDDKERPH